MRNIILPIVLVAVVLISGCSQNQPPSQQGNQTNAVTIKGFSFNPSTLTVAVGTTVTWTNEDSVSHTVTSDSGSELSSPNIPSGQTYSHTFNSTGTFDYHCSIHTSMKGKIVVQ
jgi:amicyanin